MVAINIDSSDMKRIEKTLRGIKNGVPRVVVPAINRALSSGQTTIKRQIRNNYTIKYKDIPTKVRRATRHTTTGEAGGDITVKQGMLDLNKFPFTPKKPFSLAGWYAKQTGVKITPHPIVRRSARRIMHATVRKGGGGNIPHGFTAAMPSGYLGPFTRKGKERLPIKKRQAIGAPIMATQPGVGPVVNREMGDTLAKRLDHELKRVLDSAGK